MIGIQVMLIRPLDENGNLNFWATFLDCYPVQSMKLHSGSVTAVAVNHDTTMVRFYPMIIGGGGVKGFWVWLQKEGSERAICII